ncbi:MAG: DUF2946 domain-containing protein [Burkholderiales bacterium]
MPRHRLVHRLGAAAAIFAVLLASLAPAVTSALAAAHDQHVLWTAVCTADGARLVPVPTDADGTPIAPKPGHVGECPFCAAGAATHALPPAAPIADFLPAGHDPVAVPAALAPRPPAPWAATQPRAPPFAS